MSENSHSVRRPNPALNANTTCPDGAASLALIDGNGRVLVRDIAAAENVPKHFPSKILHTSYSRGLVNRPSVRAVVSYWRRRDIP